MSTLPLASDDVPLDFWEHGSIRQVLEEEFEMSLLRLLQERGLTLNATDEKRLRDVIVPEVFLDVTDSIGWTPEEEKAHAFSEAHRRIIQNRMRRMLLEQMKEGSSAASFAERGWTLQPLALVFRTLPRKLKNFFSP